MLHEAVALSLDIDPAKVRKAYLSGGLMRCDEGREFDVRLMLAERCLGATLHGPLNWLAVRYYDARPSIGLQTFAAWARSVGWEMPAELAGLAGDSMKSTHPNPQPDEPLVLSEQPAYRTGLAGKPTSWHLIEQELRRRHAAGERHLKRAEWARILIKWLQSTHSNAPCPTVKTLTNKLPGVISELEARATQKLGARYNR
jgi:hypothetical protein